MSKSQAQPVYLTLDPISVLTAVVYPATNSNQAQSPGVVIVGDDQAVTINPAT